MAGLSLRGRRARLCAAGAPRIPTADRPTFAVQFRVNELAMLVAVLLGGILTVGGGAFAWMMLAAGRSRRVRFPASRRRGRFPPQGGSALPAEPRRDASGRRFDERLATISRYREVSKGAAELRTVVENMFLGRVVQVHQPPAPMVSTGEVKASYLPVGDIKPTDVQELGSLRPGNGKGDITYFPVGDPSPPPKRCLAAVPVGDVNPAEVLAEWVYDDRIALSSVDPSVRPDVEALVVARIRNTLDEPPIPTPTCEPRTVRK